MNRLSQILPRLKSKQTDLSMIVTRQLGSRELPEDFDQRLTAALKMWAEKHPHPDEIVLLSDSVDLSARQLAKEVERRSNIGKNGVRAVGLTLKQALILAPINS